MSYAASAEERRAGSTYDIWRSRVHPDDLALAEPVEGNLSYHSGQQSNTFRVVLPGGAIRYIQSSSVREYDREGGHARTIGINRDITDQIRYQQLLEDTNTGARVATRTADASSSARRTPAFRQRRTSSSP